MRRRSKRKLTLIIILLLLLLLLGAWYVNYRATRSLSFSFAVPGASDALYPPEYLYSFSGDETQQLQRPIGILVFGDRVFVSDGRLKLIFEFTLDGEFVKSFGEDILDVPLYLAVNPIDGNLYVSDRGARQMHIFTLEGDYVGEHEPQIPDELIVDIDTKGAVWVPTAMDFAPDGSFFAIDILTGHRLLVFDPSGELIRAVGDIGVVDDPADAPLVFQFPNGLVYHNDLIWVADSNNRRVQVYQTNGDFEKILVTQGLPRGLDFLNRPSGADTATPDRLVVADTLAHDVTIWTEEGVKLLNFGTLGVLEGQFSFPNDLSIAEDNRIFVTDTSNSRVQVWGWPADLSPLPAIPIPQNWGWCLTPLLLLPLLILRRKKRFVATEDFVAAMAERGLLHEMPARRREWIVRSDEYERLKDISQGDVHLADLLEPGEHSDSDARSLQDRLEIGFEAGVTLALAQRAKVFCTEDIEMRRFAKILDVDVVDVPEFLERFGSKNAKDDRVDIS